MYSDAELEARDRQWEIDRAELLRSLEEYFKRHPSVGAGMIEMVSEMGNG